MISKLLLIILIVLSRGLTDESKKRHAGALASNLPRSPSRNASQSRKVRNFECNIRILVVLKANENQTHERDSNRCVFTQALNPEACHVYPHRALRNVSFTRQLLVSLAPLFGTEKCDRWKSLLTGRDASFIDSARNMKALNELIHTWWGRARIGIQPLEKLENGVRVAFRWLPDTNVHFILESTDFDLSTDWRSRPGHREPLTIPHFITHRAIQDGETVDVVSEDPANRLDWDILELQWSLVRICSLCGAGEAGDEPDDDEEEDDVRGRTRMLCDEMDELALKPRRQVEIHTRSESKVLPTVPARAAGSENAPFQSF